MQRIHVYNLVKFYKYSLIGFFTTLLSRFLACIFRYNFHLFVYLLKMVLTSNLLTFWRKCIRWVKVSTTYHGHRRTYITIFKYETYNYNNIYFFYKVHWSTFQWNDYKSAPHQLLMVPQLHLHITNLSTNEGITQHPSQVYQNIIKALW